MTTDAPCMTSEHVLALGNVTAYDRGMFVNLFQSGLEVSYFSRINLWQRGLSKQTMRNTTIILPIFSNTPLPTSQSKTFINHSLVRHTKKITNSKRKRRIKYTRNCKQSSTCKTCQKTNSTTIQRIELAYFSRTIHN